MRKLLVILLIAFGSFLCIPSFAQFNVYHPFPDSNAWWSQSANSYVSCAVTTYYDYYVKGDTVVNGKTYFKVNTSGSEEVAGCPPYTAWNSYDYFYCLIREDTVAKKIYASFKPNLGKDTLLYDFNLNVGDTLPVSYLNDSAFLKNHVQSIDSILIGPHYRKQFIIANDTEPYWKDSLIEGIGSIQGLFTPIESIFGEGSIYLKCFTQNDTISTMYANIGGECQIFSLGIPTLQQPEQSITTYPNPSTGKFTITFTQPELISSVQTIEVFNVLGEQVYNETLKQVQDENVINISKQPAGIYFYRVITEDGSFIGEGKLILQK